MTTNPSSFRGPFIVVTTLFFMWGFITVMVDAFVPRLKDVFELNLLQAGLVQFAWFAAYGILSIPGGNLIDIKPPSFTRRGSSSKSEAMW